MACTLTLSVFGTRSSDADTGRERRASFTTAIHSRTCMHETQLHFWPAFRTLMLSGALMIPACGDSPSTPSPTTTTITLTASGATPREVVISAGSRVTFHNADVRAHGMSSDPVQTHTDCPAINDVGTLAPGQSRNSGVLNVARVCGFHDHNNEDDPAFKGRIIVQ
jgi:plastocyanin